MFVSISYFKHESKLIFVTFMMWLFTWLEINKRSEFFNIIFTGIFLWCIKFIFYVSVRNKISRIQMSAFALRKKESKWFCMFWSRALTIAFGFYGDRSLWVWHVIFWFELLRERETSTQSVLFVRVCVCVCTVIYGNPQQSSHNSAFPQQQPENTTHSLSLTHRDFWAPSHSFMGL